MRLDEILMLEEIKPGQMMKPGRVYRAACPTAETGWLVYQAPTKPQPNTYGLTEWAAFDAINLGD